ncbi:MAG: ATP synthase F0 subunit B [Pirellulales bacterium]|nr:ATP synthase F0 subunit B [Pirellulales bacterium]
MKTSAFFTILLAASLVVPGVFLTPAAAHAEEDAHAGSEAGDIQSPVPLRWEDVKTDLALWTGVVFLLLLLALSPLWKQILQGLDKREKGIADQIDQAEQANRQAQERLEEYEKRLAAAGEEVRALIEQGRRDAEKAGQELIEKAREESKLEQARSLRQIESAEAAALKNLADRSAALALDLAGRIVHAKLSRKDHEALIEQAVSRFAESSSGAAKVSRN